MLVAQEMYDVLTSDRIEWINELHVYHVYLSRSDEPYEALHIWS